MTVTLRFTWNKAGYMNAARQVSREALSSLESPAHTAWLSIAPVGTARPGHEAGQLRESWKSWIRTSALSCWLFFGAFTRYAIYVELGTGKMAPRAPVRRTAGIITPLLKQYLETAAKQHGMTVR